MQLRYSISTESFCPSTNFEFNQAFIEIAPHYSVINFHTYDLRKSITTFIPEKSGLTCLIPFDDNYSYTFILYRTILIPILYIVYIFFIIVNKLLKDGAFQYIQKKYIL